MASEIYFVECFAAFRGVLSTPPKTEQMKTFQHLVRFALDSKEPHPDVWFGARLPWATQDKRGYVWCLGSDNLTAWIGVAHRIRQDFTPLVIPEPAFVYPTIDAAVMACLHRKPSI